jgi:hypothetical protein
LAGAPDFCELDIPGPSSSIATSREAAFAFDTAYRAIWFRISQLVALPLQSFDKAALQTRLFNIGRVARSKT